MSIFRLKTQKNQLFYEKNEKKVLKNLVEPEKVTTFATAYEK